MSDIPVGSPPAPPGRHAAPSGWYQDPVDRAQERYWDGWQWSRNTRVSEQPGSRPNAGSAGPSVAPYPPQPNPQQQYPQQQPPYGQQPMPGHPSPYPSQPPGGPYQPRPATGPATADGVPLASWWWRVLASALDTVIGSIITALPSIPVYLGLVPAFQEFLDRSMEAARTGGVAPDPNTLIPARQLLILTVISLTVALIYHSVFLAVKSATPGKMICGLRVVPVDQGRSQQRLPLNTVIIRVLVWVLPGASSWLLIVKVADIAWPLWHPKRQALHDLAAKTQVVRPGR